jgi:hypothetical protein
MMATTRVAMNVRVIMENRFSPLLIGRSRQNLS